MRRSSLLWFACVGLVYLIAGESSFGGSNTVRIAAAQPQRRSVDWHMREPKDVLARVDKSLGELEALIDKAAEEKCDVIAFPEDTLGLGLWEADNHGIAGAVLPEAVQSMRSRFGAAAAKHHLYVLCCSHHVESDGATYNTAFLIGRDGKEIGRYHKTCLTIHEGTCKPGTELPVFHTPDCGEVGMLICYDLVFPETARCLALKGADVIFHLTLGGAAIGDDDISLAAFRTRAVENFVYLVVAQRGSGSMIISPQGKILAEAKGPDSLATADIDPFGGREGGDAYNTQRDMRARLFRERNPGAFGVLTETNPPALAKVPLKLSREEATRISNRVVTLGEEEFRAANKLAAQHETKAAIREFTRLRRDYPESWIDFESARRIQQLGPEAAKLNSAGCAANYPGDAGIEKDAAVVFAENFEENSIPELEKRWEDTKAPEIMSFSEDIPPGSGGKHSLLFTYVGGKGTGGHLYRRLLPGYDKLYVRFYTKFDAGCAPIHHFFHIGGHNPSTPYPQGGAGERPQGDRDFSVGLEPFGNSWTWDYYAYWMEMRGSPPKGQTWGNSFIRDSNLGVQKGKWTCVEAMIQMNHPEDHDGELALWIDGQPVSHLGKGFPKGKWLFDTFNPGQGGEGVRWDDQKGAPERFPVAAGGEPFEGFRWRKDAGLNLNYLWLLLYITDAAPGQVSRVWFDDIVIATNYIGPIQPK